MVTALHDIGTPAARSAIHCAMQQGFNKLGFFDPTGKVGKLGRHIRNELFLWTMWLNEKQIPLLTTLGLVIVVIPAVVYLYLLTKSPLSFKEMDFNDNGIVTFSELMYASSYGVRVIQKDERFCEEYYSLNDGKILRADCK